MAPKGLREVARVSRIGADIRVLPRPDFGEEIVRVPVLDVVVFPIDEKVFDRRVAFALEMSVPVELLRVRPTGIDPARRLSTRAQAASGSLPPFHALSACSAALMPSRKT